MTEIYRHQRWTDRELRTAGFQRYARRKELVMARRLPAAEAPLTLNVDDETVSVPAGYIICYKPGQQVKKRLIDYEQWPCSRSDFQATYAAWDEQNWQPTPAVLDLMRQGCKPYYKRAGVWAKRLTEATQVQSKESAEPFLVPAGHWLVLGVDGAPYHMDDRSFQQRYTLESGG
ncbi:MAG: hypothetical protein JNJ61_21540 [Anaerolineae bacterium]|nr:hypothetical protein [Anaerolineae bacterium]